MQNVIYLIYKYITFQYMEIEEQQQKKIRILIKYLEKYKLLNEESVNKIKKLLKKKRNIIMK